MILRLISEPVGARTLSYEVHQIHVDQQKDVVAHAVTAKHVYVERREVPYLDDSQSAYYVREESGAGNKAVLKVAEKSIVAAHHVYEDEVVYELQIFYLFLFVLQLEHSMSNASPPSV